MAGEMARERKGVGEEGVERREGGEEWGEKVADRLRFNFQVTASCVTWESRHILGGSDAHTGAHTQAHTPKHTPKRMCLGGSIQGSALCVHVYVCINVCCADISRAVDIYHAWHLALSSATKLISQTPNISTICLPPNPLFYSPSQPSPFLSPSKALVALSPSSFFSLIFNLFMLTLLTCVNLSTLLFCLISTPFLPFLGGPADCYWRLWQLINTYRLWDTHTHTLSLSHTHTHAHTISFKPNRRRNYKVRAKQWKMAEWKEDVDWSRQNKLNRNHLPYWRSAFNYPLMRQRQRDGCDERVGKREEEQEGERGWWWWRGERAREWNCWGGGLLFSSNNSSIREKCMWN